MKEQALSNKRFLWAAHFFVWQCSLTLVVRIRSLIHAVWQRVKITLPFTLMQISLPFWMTGSLLVSHHYLDQERHLGLKVISWIVLLFPQRPQHSSGRWCVHVCKHGGICAFALGKPPLLIKSCLLCLRVNLSVIVSMNWGDMFLKPHSQSQLHQSERERERMNGAQACLQMRRIVSENPRPTERGWKERRLMKKGRDNDVQENWVSCNT